MNLNIDLWDEIHKKKIWASDGDYPSPNAQAFLAWHLLVDASKVSRLLDLGCGTGAATCYFKRMLPETEVHGIDASESALLQAKSRSMLLEVAIEFKKSDFRSLPYPSGYFQAIFSESVLYYGNKDDFEKGVHEIFRTLAPGGVCRVYTKTNNDMWTKEGEEIEKNVFLVKSESWEAGLSIYCAPKEEIKNIFSCFTDVKIGIKEFNYINTDKLHSFWSIAAKKSY